MSPVLNVACRSVAAARIAISRQLQTSLRVCSVRSAYRGIKGMSNTNTAFRGRGSISREMAPWLRIRTPLDMDNRFVEPLAVEAHSAPASHPQLARLPFGRRLLLAPLGSGSGSTTLKSADVKGGPTPTMTLRCGRLLPAPGGRRGLLEIPSGQCWSSGSPSWQSTSLRRPQSRPSRPRQKNHRWRNPFAVRQQLCS